MTLPWHGTHVLQITNEFKRSLPSVNERTTFGTDWAAAMFIPGKVGLMKMKYLGIIADENKRLESQVADVLQMAQLDKNELKLNLLTVNLHTIIKQAVDKISIQLERKSGNLKLALNAAQFKLKGDEAHLLGILLNLLDNALKYSNDAS